VTDQTASEDRLSQRAARYRRLADRVIAAAAERGGFVVVSGAPLSGRRALQRAIADTAEAQFQVVEIANAVGPRIAGPAGAPNTSGAATRPPLFVIDDAALESSAGLCDICETAPLSPEWAAMLSVRAVLITRFPLTELQFLAPRIIACIAFSEDAAETAELAVSGPAATPTRADDVSRPDPATPVAKRRQTAGPGADGIAAAQSHPPARPPAGRDLRLFALLAYLAAVGALGGCYLALQNRQADWPSLASAAGRTTAAVAAAGCEVAK
jgi:hypothetical protein